VPDRIADLWARGAHTVPTRTLRTLAGSGPLKSTSTCAQVSRRTTSSPECKVLPCCTATVPRSLAAIARRRVVAMWSEEACGGVARVVPHPILAEGAVVHDLSTGI
jgi:hypothetical protein